MNSAARGRRGAAVTCAGAVDGRVTRANRFHYIPESLLGRPLRG